MEWLIAGPEVGGGGVGGEMRLERWVEVRPPRILNAEPEDLATNEKAKGNGAVF